LFTADGNDLLVNLSQSLGVLSGSLQLSNPEVAADIPTGLDQLLVSLGDDIRGMELWRAAQEAEQLTVTLFVASLVVGVGVVALDPDVRRGVFKVSLALAAAGFLLVGVAILAPRIVAATTSDEALGRALESGLEIFVSDLKVLGLWVVGYGV